MKSFSYFFLQFVPISAKILSNILFSFSLFSFFPLCYTNYRPKLLSTEDGIYFYGCYNGPGSSWLYDVLDSDGDVVVSGLRTCAGYYANSVNGLPEGVFAAVKGFESGWMDLTGQWLYAESIFASSNDEMDNGFF